MITNCTSLDYSQSSNDDAVSQTRENWQHNCMVIDPTSSSKEANVPLLKQDEDVCCRNIITKNSLNKVKITSYLLTHGT